MQEGCSEISSPEFLEFAELSFGGGGCNSGSESPSHTLRSPDVGSLHKLPKIVEEKHDPTPTKTLEFGNFLGPDLRFSELSGSMFPCEENNLLPPSRVGVSCFSREKTYSHSVSGIKEISKFRLGNCGFWWEWGRVFL